MWPFKSKSKPSKSKLVQEVVVDELLGQSIGTPYQIITGIEHWDDTPSLCFVFHRIPMSGGGDLRLYYPYGMSRERAIKAAHAIADGYRAVYSILLEQKVSELD